jgi:hypothetical protein
MSKAKVSAKTLAILAAGRKKLAEKKAKKKSPAKK